MGTHTNLRPCTPCSVNLPSEKELTLDTKTLDTNLTRMLAGWSRSLRETRESSPVARVTQEKKPVRNPFTTEEECSAFLRNQFKQWGWLYREEFKTRSNKAIDFLIKARHNGGHIFFGVECKKGMDELTAATAFADHFEQARAYAHDLKMPVFVGPIFTRHDPSASYKGGPNISAIAGLNIFGGRSNVGSLIFQMDWHNDKRIREQYAIMRGDIFWSSNKDNRHTCENGFNPKRLNLVSTTGSKRERVDMKVWHGNR